MKRVIGFDVSSTTIGYSVFDFEEDSINLIKCAYIKPIKSKNILERLKYVQEKINDILNQYKPDYIGIEEITQFMPNLTSANTIITLAVFNRIVGLTCLNYLKKSPEMFSVMSMRHGLKTSSVLPKKEGMPQLVETYLNIKFPYEFKKNGNIKLESYDMADACIVGLYYIFKLTNKLDKIKKARKF